MGGGKGGSKRQVYDFLLSLDYGICHGPVASINRVRMKEKDAFVGPVTESGVAFVDRRQLFGGDESEGGVFGAMEFYVGDYDQLMSEQLAARYGLTPSEAPGYRGLAHVFFRGERTEQQGGGSFFELFFGAIFQAINYAATGAINTVAEGFYGFQFTSNNPYLPATEISVTRASDGLDHDPFIYPAIGIDENGDYIVAAEGDAFAGSTFDPTKAPDGNPANMLYEVYINDAWGKGESPSAMNKASFEAAAATLLAENFGLSMIWVQQTEIEKFASEILDHIKGMVFQDPETGLWTLKLIRDDYVLADCPVLNESNADLNTIKTRIWGETINEIKVSYTDPSSEEEETVSSQNLANIAIQGGVISETREYHGVRNPFLAQTLADRDVLEASRTLVTATVFVNREGFNIKPGDVVNFSWEEEEIEQMACRVMDVDYGKKDDRRIKLQLAEDIFSARRIVTLSAQEPPADGVDDPSPPDRVFIMTPPLPPLLENGVDAAEIDAEYPISYALFMAHDITTSFIDIQADTDIMLPNGDPSVGPVTTFPPSRSGLLQVDLDQEAHSVIPNIAFEVILRRPPEIGDRFVIGESEELHEIIMLDSYDEGNDEWSVMRGLYDTQPLAWLSSDRLWHMPEGSANVDFTDRPAGSEVSYWLRPRTTLGRLPLADADEELFTPSERLHQPFRPANCQIEGNGFGDTQYLAGAIPAEIELTWANRNRLGEDAVAQAWDDTSSAMEDGQTVTLRFVDALDGAVDFEVTGLTGTSYTLDPDNLPSYRFYEVHFLSERDGLESREPVIRTLELERLGYGANYGYDYDENDGS
jgi:hypothetical protein